MRLSKLALPLATFLIAGGLSALAATFTAQLVEDSSVVGVRRALDVEGLTWADADANGLQLFLIGTAPSEAARFRALTTAGTVVDAARVIDQMDIEDSMALAPPEFSIEMLRNDSGIYLIGLIPADTDREALQQQAGGLVAEGQVSDLLETADYPSPPGWQEALDFAFVALKDLPRSKISMAADRVAIIAMTESQDEKRNIEARLLRQVPDGTRLALDLSAPRPVITPFTLRFVVDTERGARFDACSADEQATRDRIIASARRAGVTGQVACRIGLGVPSKTWGQAAELGIEAVVAMGGGSVTFSDADVQLVAREGTAQAEFDRIAGELEARLPEVFALEAILPKPETGETSGAAPEFIAIRSPEGMVQLRGRVHSDIARRTADSFAQAKFGADTVYMSARVDDSLPASWSVRVLAALQALSFLENGAVTVTPDSVRVIGNTGRKEASDEIAALLATKLGDGGPSAYDINITYQEKLDPIASQPTPEQCEQAIGRIVAERKINFEPGSATLDREAQGILDDIAEVLKQCGAIRLEIQGHTDSQGREVMNQQLSQARAQSVLNELRGRRVLTSSYTAKGYGEATPVADNKTEAGREANRRIEFHLIRPEPVKEEQTTLESVAQSGQTDGEASDTTGDASEEAGTGGQN